MNALQKLVAVINDMAAPTHVAPAAPAPLLDPFMDNQLFDISSGAGAATWLQHPHLWMLQGMEHLDSSHDSSFPYKSKPLNHDRPLPHHMV